MVKSKEIRAMSEDDRKAKLADLRKELLHERGMASMGGAPTSPGKIRAVRTSIARTFTIINEERAKTKAKAAPSKNNKSQIVRDFQSRTCAVEDSALAAEAKIKGGAK